MSRLISLITIFSVTLIISCRTSGRKTAPSAVSALTDCGDLKTFVLAPLPGVSSDESLQLESQSNALMVSHTTYYFQYCPSRQGLMGIVKEGNRSGMRTIEVSLPQRFSDASGIDQTFGQGRTTTLKLLVESRKFRISGDRFQGIDVVVVASTDGGIFAPAPIFGRLQSVADIPRPEISNIFPPTQTSFLTCQNRDHDLQSFRVNDVHRGSDQFQLQLDICFDGNEQAAQAAVLLVYKSEWNGQLQTDLIEMPTRDLDGVKAVAFEETTPATTIDFSTLQPQGRNQVSKISLKGRDDGQLDLLLNDTLVAPVSFEYGALTSSGGCLPGEEVFTSKIVFGNKPQVTSILLTGCKTRQFGATGTTSYSLKKVEIADNDPRLTVASRVIEGPNLASHTKLVTTHHNSCDKLEITFPDVQYGLTSPDMFSFGNECQEDIGIAPPNPSLEVLAIRKRVVATSVQETYFIPWGSSLTFSPGIVLSPESDPID